VVIQRGANGNYYFATTTASFVSPSALAQLYSESQYSVVGVNQSLGFQMGGPGQFNINAASLNLGSSAGILSLGVSSEYNSVNYASLAPWTPSGSGASVNVNVTGEISLLTSTIASIDGGNVLVNCGGALNLSQGNFAFIPPSSGIVCYGIFTSGDSDVSVVAGQDINVGGARIAAFNGGNVFVESEYGSVNAGNGANSLLVVPVIRLDPATGQPISDQIENPRPFGSGIMAITPTAEYQAPGSSGLPGNITVLTPQGDIVSTLGGIQQFALNGTVTAGPTITLTAGTPNPLPGLPPLYAGNVNLGSGGVIGGEITINAQGSITGLIVSHQDANITASQNIGVTLLSGGFGHLTASGTISGTAIGIGGVTASGGATVTATMLGQNVSVGGGPAQSTLGTAAAATSTSQAASQQANTDTQQQLAKDTSAQPEDDSKKKGSKAPTLTRHVGRVTVILPKT
jgi:hypothetical protein